jgi:rod shape-determining protein MreD
MAAYHWTICRPDLLPAVALFVIGTVEDLLAGGLPGETAVTLLLCRALVLRHRHYFAGRQFAITWAGFAVVTCGAALFSWALNSLLFGHFLDSAKPLFDAMLTISVFPIVSFLLSRSQLALIKAD